jgi:putative acetyltransferase
VAADRDAILELYRLVASTPGGLARTADEVSTEYVGQFLSHSLARGLSLCARSGPRIVGEIHAYTPTPAVFRHVLGDLTIAVDPAMQGRGVGRRHRARRADRAREQRKGPCVL